MKNINDLDKALKQSLSDFAIEIQDKVSTFNKGESLSEYDMDDIAKNVFYLMEDFRNNIIEYLKDNTDV